jgi:hypothetical protein
MRLNLIARDSAGRHFRFLFWAVPIAGREWRFAMGQYIRNSPYIPEVITPLPYDLLRIASSTTS